MTMADLIARLEQMPTDPEAVKTIEVIRDSLIELCKVMGAVRVQSQDTHNDLAELKESIEAIKKQISN